MALCACLDGLEPDLLLQWAVLQSPSPCLFYQRPFSKRDQLRQHKVPLEWGDDKQNTRTSKSRPIPCSNYPLCYIPKFTSHTAAAFQSPVPALSAASWLFHHVLLHYSQLLRQTSAILLLFLHREYQQECHAVCPPPYFLHIHVLKATGVSENKERKKLM